MKIPSISAIHIILNMAIKLAVIFTKTSPTNGTYHLLEYGYYFSDWRNTDGDSDVSDSCQKMNVLSTFPINIDIGVESLSIADWER